MEGTRKLVFLMAVTYVLSPQVGRTSSEPDHLLPADRSRDRSYFSLLDRKLATTPFDCGRIVVRPPFTGEHSISVYSKPTRNRLSRYQITMRAAQESLWQASLAGVDPMKGQSISISEANIVITAELAKLLKGVLTAMVAETRPLGADEKPRKIVIEGPLTDIMIVRRSGKLEIGQMGNFPPTTPKLKLLTKLITNLTRLSQSPASDRAHLVAEVTSDADALRRKLSKQ